MTRAICPDVRQLRALLDEDASGGEEEELVKHLETCVDCQQTLETLTTKPPEWMRSDPGPQDAAWEELDLFQLVQRLKSEETLCSLRPAKEPVLVGQLGDYQVQEEIGRGGMGVVFKALDSALNRVVAIKVLSPWLAGSATARRRFVREARAAAAVCHEHIVSIHGVHEADGMLYLVMEHVSGESLQDRLDRTGPLEVVDIVQIGLQTAQGLAAAHALGLIHRDIKPANLLLSTAGGLAGRVSEGPTKPPAVKITDFGLARMVDDVGLTQNGVVAGTPEYMSPEQARGEPVDHRSDLFSLGSVLYACCTGLPPFRANTALTVLRAICEEEPAPIRLLNPDVPAWLETFVVRLLGKRPTERFHSAAEVATLLESYLAHLRHPCSIAVPPFPPAPESRKTQPSLSRLLGVMAGVFLVIGLGLNLWPMAQVPPPSRPTRMEFYQNYRGSTPPHPALKLVGQRDEGVVIEPQVAGLRISLSAGRERPDLAGVGLDSTVGGNFEITTGYELIMANRPRSGSGVGVELYVTVDTPARDTLAFTRVKRVDGSDLYICHHRLDKDGKRESRRKVFPTSARSGRLRLSREGEQVTFWAADEENDFQELCRFEVEHADVRFIRMVAYRGGTPEAVEVRIRDLRVRADKIIPLPVAEGAAAVDGPGLHVVPKYWLMIVEIVALVLTLALIGVVAWHRTRRRGMAPAQEKPLQPEAEQIISFSCPACGKSIKASATLAGKKVRCPKCSETLLVPEHTQGAT